MFTANIVHPSGDLLLNPAAAPAIAPTPHSGTLIKMIRYPRNVLWNIQVYIGRIDPRHNARTEIASQRVILRVNLPPALLFIAIINRAHAHQPNPKRRDDLIKDKGLW